MIQWSLLEWSMVHSSWCHFLARMCGMWKTIHLCCHIYSKPIVHLTFQVVRSLQYIVQCTIYGAICRNSHNIPHHFAMWLVVRTYHRERYFFALALGLALYHLPSNIVIRLLKCSFCSLLRVVSVFVLQMSTSYLVLMLSIVCMSMILLGRSLYLM
jgi:hypothetical protein